MIVSECFLSPKAWALNEPQRQKKASTFPTDVRQSARDNGDSAFALMVVVVFNWASLHIHLSLWQPPHPHTLILSLYLCNTIFKRCRVDSYVTGTCNSYVTGNSLYKLLEIFMVFHFWINFICLLFQNESQYEDYIINKGKIDKDIEY